MRSRKSEWFGVFCCWRAVVIVALFAVFPLSGDGASSDPDIAGEENCTSDVMIVLDASGSMLATDFPEGAPNRMQRVQSALSKVLPGVAAARRVGLIIYGPGANENSCHNVEVRLRPTANAARKILDVTERLQPAGRTPLARSVEVAVDVLREGGRPAEVVVLTDGEDTCGGDPCQSAQKVSDGSASVRVHVVGFRLPDNSESSGARCLARHTGGKFVTAESTDALAMALQQVLQCQEISMDVQGGGLNTPPGPKVKISQLRQCTLDFCPAF